MSDAFKRSLSSDWIKYVAVILLSVALWVGAFGMYHAPKEYERIEVFFAGKVKDYSFESLAVKSVEGIKKTEISSCSPAENTFLHKYSVVGLNGADVVIVPLSIADKTDCRGTFLSLEGVGEPYVREDETFGVYLPDSAIASLAPYFEFGEERYVAFVAASSVNAGKLTNHAVQFVKWLVEYV